MTEQTIDEKRKVEILDDSLLEPYNSSIQSFKGRARESLGQFTAFDGKLAGSNPFMFVHLVNSDLLLEGMTLTTRKDLETELSTNPSFLQGNYADFGLALRTARDTYKPKNDLLAKTLVTQLRLRGISLGKGKLISLNDLRLEENKNSAYGLVFKLNDTATKETVKDLREFNWDWTREEGLACANRCDWGWGSSYGGLDRSGGDGRVVVVRARGTPRKISDAPLILVPEFKDGSEEVITRASEARKYLAQGDEARARAAIKSAVKNLYQLQARLSSFTRAPESLREAQLYLRKADGIIKAVYEIMPIRAEDRE